METTSLINYLLHPSTIVISGPTGCGKTQFTLRLIRESYFSKRIERIIWYYSKWQSAYDQLRLLRPDTEFVQDMDKRFYDSISPSKNNLLVLDDAMIKLGDSDLLKSMYVEGSHHQNMTVIYLTQNIFDKGKANRTVSVNSQYMVLFKNPRDEGQIACLARQMKGTDWRVLVDAFEQATAEPHSYLLVDLRQETDQRHRLRSNVMSENGDLPVVYIPQKYLE